MFEKNDKEMLGIMINSLNSYLRAAGRISKQRFDELSEYNGLLWLEITKQKEILEDIISRVGKGGKDEQEEQSPECADNKCSNGNIDGQVNLYNEMIGFLKKLKHIDLHWVRVYSVKFPQPGNLDFEIKYFEHKEPSQQHKNYLLFGDAANSYAIRKSGNEITGDTNRCFEYILNFRSRIK